MHPLIFLGSWLLIIAAVVWTVVVFPDAAWVRAVERLGGSQEPRTPAQQQHSRQMLFAQGTRYTLSGVLLLTYALTPLGQQLQYQGYGPIFLLLALIVPFICYLPVWIVWLKRPR